MNASPSLPRWLPGGAETLFFDFDGTLCASEPDIRNAWQETLQTLHLECPHFDRTFRTGPMVQQMAQMLFPKKSEEERAQIVAEFKQRYDHSDFPRTFPYPGVDAWLRALHHAGRTLCLVTNRRELATKTILKKLDWTTLFVGFFCSDRGGSLTAKPELLRLALRQKEFSRKPAVMIGDTAHDVDTGRANGILTAGVLWGYGRSGELEAAHPDYLLTLQDISC